MITEHCERLNQTWLAAVQHQNTPPRTSSLGFRTAPTDCTLQATLKYYGFMQRFLNKTMRW